MDYEKLATGLLARHRDCEAATRPIDKRLTLARFQGMCEGGHRLGIGMTPDAIHIAVVDVIRTSEPRPAFQPAGKNLDLKAYDAEQAKTLAQALRDLP